MLVQKKTPHNAPGQWLKKICRLENLIGLTVAGLPLYLVKMNFFGLPTNALDFLQAAVVFWWYFDNKYKKPKTREITENYGKYLMATGLLFFGLFSSLVINGNYLVGLGIIKSWFLLPAFFAFAAVNVIDTEEKIKNTLRAFYFSSAAVSLIALAYYFFGHLTYDGRLEAFFNSPNYLATYLAPGLIIGAFFLKEEKKIFTGCLLLLTLSFYLTRSYAAWGAVGLAIASTGVIGKKEVKKIAGGTLLILALFLLLQVGTRKWENFSVLEERSSFSSRIMIWQAAEKIAGDNLVWGIGPGNFQNKYLEYQKFFPPYLEWAVPHPHNLFLTFFLYSGLAGLVGFVWLSFAWLKTVMGKEDSRLKLLFLALMAYIFIHGLVDTTYFKNDLAMLFWLNFLALNLKKAP